ncbi:cell division topological specificity factor MinE [Alkalilimnicola sp. S0819]|uniref:cell division topological specificity factor MinE n=1 Tax=Alkalilimnicola sp. S0819 TaxID=2613922 RepID=UPI001262493C|nr:cell division topological specificity factor MinE [Alkalilimnicola sp. S0819]KAB7622554.1 cell division topological specificity factor MinE [Alkalilimnicola sp. S0819]MPQ17441.1 cell division topological specificity factor MinE [Alkalilimnicola sp. S0819]
MSFFNYFRSQKQRSASVAKERLQIIVAHERSTRGGPDYLPMLQEELLEVIRKYVQVGRDAVKMQIDKDGDCEVLELNIMLPEEELKKAR